MACGYGGGKDRRGRGGVRGNGLSRRGRSLLSTFWGTWVTAQLRHNRGKRPISAGHGLETEPSARSRLG